MASETETAVVQSTALQGEILPAPTSGGELVSLAASSASKVPEARARELAQQIDLKNTQSIMTFGMDRQKAATQVSEQMLQGVKTGQMGEAGTEMNNMVRSMKGMDLGELANAKKPGFLKKLLGGAGALQKFLDKYKTVEEQIIAAMNVLESHRVQMLKDIVAMDRQYDATLTLVHDLDEQIAALKWLIDDINTNRLPPMQAKAKETGDIEDAQIANDLAEQRDEVERRHADLLLVRNLAIQALPSIRLIQSGEKGMATKIATQLTVGVDVWKRTMALQIAAWRAEEAGNASKAATDYTNELITTAAKQIQSSTKITRTEMERGVFDVQAAVTANDILIATITESLDIAEQGRKNRAEAAKALEDAETKLKQSLIAAAERQAQISAR